ncbi:MAG TPA: hypothetical protein VER17_07580 [Tepidisphaeraceae bacterium]|nr:hypothetical protein [Tepidisphaeraceae bacterium]
MGEDDIPPEVKAFLADHIESVLQLEVLLLLRSRAGEGWSADAVSREFRIDSAWTGGQLATLAGSGLLSHAPGGQFHYAPRSPALDQAVAATAEAYATRRVTLIGLIFSKPPSPLRSFADAFRIRKEPKHDG